MVLTSSEASYRSREGLFLREIAPRKQITPMNFLISVFKTKLERGGSAPFSLKCHLEASRGVANVLVILVNIFAKICKRLQVFYFQINIL